MSMINEKLLLEKKRAVESALKEIVSAFETDTGLLIEDVNIMRGQGMDDRRPHTVGVEIKAVFEV